MHLTLHPPALLPSHSSLQDPNEPESIYNLIPLHPQAFKKSKRYVSQYAGEVRKEYKTGLREAGTLGKEMKNDKKGEFVKRGDGEQRRTKEGRSEYQ